MIENADETPYAAPSMVEMCPRCCTPGSACDVLYGASPRPTDGTGTAGCTDADPCAWRNTDFERPITDHDEMVMWFDRLVVAVSRLEESMGLEPVAWTNRIIRPTDPAMGHECMIRVADEIVLRINDLVTTVKLHTLRAQLAGHSSPYQDATQTDKTDQTADHETSETPRRVNPAAREQATNHYPPPQPVGGLWARIRRISPFRIPPYKANGSTNGHENDTRSEDQK